MSPEETTPQQKTPDVETETPDIPMTEYKAPEKMETKPKKKRAPSKQKKSEDGGVVQAEAPLPSPGGGEVIAPPAVIETPPVTLSTEDKLVDKAVRFINEKANKAVYKGSAEIGAYVLKNFFNDDIELASSRNPHKPESYSKLCRHSELLVTSDALGVMVRVAAQEKFFSDNNADTTGLSYSHKAELVKLHNGEAKLDTVRLALEKGWSVKYLKEVVYDMREDRMGREPDSEILLLGRYVKSLVTWHDKLSNPRGEQLFDDDKKRKAHLRSLKGKTRQRLRENVGEALEAARELVESYELLQRDLEGIELEKQPKKP